MSDRGSQSHRSFNRRAAFAASAGLAAMSGTVLSRHGQAAAQDATPVGGTPAPDPVSRTVPRVFADDDFEFQFLIALGQTYERAADVGECFAAAAAITEGDYDSWFDTFFALGERIRGDAETADAGGHAESARDAFLRAATYYGQAYFFADGTKDPSRLVPTWEAHRAAFDAFAARLDPPAEVVEIPYEGTTLPGYALTVDTSGQPRPWLIMNNGSDGTAADMWAQGSAAALRRGYNTLIFDGPGQGAALFRQGLHFRPDWERSSPRSSTGSWRDPTSIRRGWRSSASARVATGYPAQSPSSIASPRRSPTPASSESGTRGRPGFRRKCSRSCGTPRAMN